MLPKFPEKIFYEIEKLNDERKKVYQLIQLICKALYKKGTRLRKNTLKN
jgi:hypothetical protein